MSGTPADTKGTIMKTILVAAFAAIVMAQPVVATAGMYRLLGCVPLGNGQYVGDYADTHGNVIRKAFYYQCPPMING
jgi:hypothetical protein